MRAPGRRALGPVARSAARTALIAVGVVAVLYALVGLLTLWIVTARLTASVDDRLAAVLMVTSIRYQVDPSRVLFQGGLPGGQAGALQATRGERFGAPILVWLIGPDGSQRTNAAGVTLPGADRDTSGFKTITLGSEQVRIDGGSVGSERLVVGLTLSGVAQAQTNLVLAELLIAPVLLLLVFAGAFLVGRRAAAPFELQRRRQQELTADASHELRTPLAVIEAETSLALTGRRTAAWYREAFRRVHGETLRMRQLVEDLLWLARLEAAAGAPARAEPVDLAALAQESARRFQPVAELKGQRLTVAAAEPAPVEVRAEWLDRLVGVLLDNACRYTPEGGVVDLRVETAGGRARLVVEDSGPGIAESERARVFDRFHRASESPGGAGLGLAIADAVVRATGGRWEVGRSDLGGARFAVSWSRTWPAAPVGRPAPAPET